MNLDELRAIRGQVATPGGMINTWSPALSGRILGILLDDLITRVEAEKVREADAALLAECYVSRYSTGAYPQVSVMHKPTHTWAKGATETEAVNQLREKLSNPYPGPGALYDHH